MNFDFSGRVAIVTGAASGLGLAISDALESAGAIVVRAGREDHDGRPGWRKLDVRHAGEVDALVTSVAGERGRLDIMVNNAGLQASPGSSVEKPPQDWSDLVDTNLNGTWYGCRAAIRQMLAQDTGGTVINISSRLALSAGGPGRAAYAASKAGISNLTRQLAVEYGQHGIRVNAICPGFIPGTLGAMARDPERIEIARRQTPSPRLGTPADVAAAALYLASDAAGFVNGHNLVVDGGASATP
jgi:NAD(P)-dependent dehydrogenase (short-subunit alcohol dehydrogenase family)